MSLTINPVLCRAGVMDNYAYILTDNDSGISAIVDASEAAPVIKRCEQLHISPSYIFTTHHHFDHVGGNVVLKEKYKLQIAGPEAERDKIPGMDIGLSDGDVFMLGNSRAEIISVPGHTLGHILWYFPKDKALFTGDVLFNLCIGGLFEGSAEQMFDSLEKIRSLPDSVLFYPGHEYTAQCLQQALRQGENKMMEQYIHTVVSRLEKGLPAAPMSLEMEKACNPYLKITNRETFKSLF